MNKLTAEEELFLYQMYLENNEKEFNEWVESMEQNVHKADPNEKEILHNIHIVFEEKLLSDTNKVIDEFNKVAKEVENW